MDRRKKGLLLTNYSQIYLDLTSESTYIALWSWSSSWEDHEYTKAIKFISQRTSRLIVANAAATHLKKGNENASTRSHKQNREEEEEEI